MPLERPDDTIVGDLRGTSKQMRFTFAVYVFTITILNIMHWYMTELYNSLAIQFAQHVVVVSGVGYGIMARCRQHVAIAPLKDVNFTAVFLTLL